MIKSEKDMKKLLTITKSKFYMLRVNFPKAFELTVDPDTLNSSSDYDPLSDKNPTASDLLNHPSSSSSTSSPFDLDEDETPEAKKKRQEQIEKDRQRFQAIDKHTEELIKGL